MSTNDKNLPMDLNNSSNTYTKKVQQIKPTFDLVSLIIGLLLGMIIMLLLVWIAYYTRSTIFAYCPRQTRFCTGIDYYHDPGDALANNPQLKADDILAVQNDIMYYNRVLKNNTCTPQNNKIVPIRYPQFCSFHNQNGNGVKYKQTFFNSNIYRPANNSGPSIVTNGNCEPIAGQAYNNGNPIIEWLPNP